MKKFIQKLIPAFLLSWYHFCLAYLGAFIYGFPSKKMVVIGVTGTKGKTTTCNLIAKILNKCGYKTGMASTVNFRIGELEWINETKQTMLGRFQLQKLLKQMVQAGCKYAVVETSSEGILQYRHRFIDYQIAVFTNLSPEHIERHGSFEKYRAEKLKLFEAVARKENGIGIYNLDDENVGYFLQIPVKRRIGYGAGKFFDVIVGNLVKRDSEAISRNRHEIAALPADWRVAHNDEVEEYKIFNIKTYPNKTEFDFNGEKLEMSLIGEFNVYNAGAAICVALSQNIPMEKIQKALAEAKPAPGRMEIIDVGQNFTAVVDYSYELVSFENALKTMKIFNPNKIITVVGPTGGGRDKWRRPKMGEIADKYADIVFITTDDPYDENPEKIIDEVLAGALKNENRVLGKNIFRIIERREAIKKAVELAQAGDVILFAGKGGEKWMNIAGNKKIPWDESEIVREEIKNLTDIKG